MALTPALFRYYEPINVFILAEKHTAIAGFVDRALCLGRLADEMSDDIGPPLD